MALLFLKFAYCTGSVPLLALGKNPPDIENAVDRLSMNI